MGGYCLYPFLLHEQCFSVPHPKKPASDIFLCLLDTITHFLCIVLVSASFQLTFVILQCIYNFYSPWTNSFQRHFFWKLKLARLCLTAFFLSFFFTQTNNWIGYEPLKREPQFANAEMSAFWEIQLVSLLCDVRSYFWKTLNRIISKAVFKASFIFSA